MKVYNKDLVLFKKRNDSLLRILQQTATLGTWNVEIDSMKTKWCEITKQIHEVDDNFCPSVDNALQFYKEGHSRDTITKLVKNCIDKFEKYDVELQIVTANGREKWVRAIGMPNVENGRCTSIYGLFQDVNEKNTALKELAYKEEKFRKTFEYAVLGMAIIDLRGRWVKVNSSLLKMLNYAEKDLEKTTFLDVTHPDDKALNKTRQLIYGEIDNYQSQTRLIDKNGKVVWTMVSVSLIRDDMGKPLNFVAQINDISNFQNASETIIDLLNTSECQNKRLLNFAHIVSHNLRSHYSNLAMLLNLMATESPDCLDNKYYPHIKSAVDSLGETLENLSDVTVLKTKENENVESLNLDAYIIKALKSINAIIIDSGAKITVEIDKGTEVLAIPAYLESIALNFITNSIKYRHPERNLRILISSKIINNFVILEIKDNGLGIDLKAHGKKLFGMYKTFHDHKDARGLGLFIAKNQVDALGGEIKVESKVNHGTTFKVYLKHEKD